MTESTITTMESGNRPAVSRLYAARGASKASHVVYVYGAGLIAAYLTPDDARQLAAELIAAASR